MSLLPRCLISEQLFLETSMRNPLLPSRLIPKTRSLLTLIGCLALTESTCPWTKALTILPFWRRLACSLPTTQFRCLRFEIDDEKIHYFWDYKVNGTRHFWLRYQEEVTLLMREAILWLKMNNRPWPPQHLWKPSGVFECSKPCVTLWDVVQSEDSWQLDLLCSCLRSDIVKRRKINSYCWHLTLPSFFSTTSKGDMKPLLSWQYM